MRIVALLVCSALLVALFAGRGEPIAAQAPAPTAEANAERDETDLVGAGALSAGAAQHAPLAERLGASDPASEPARKITLRIKTVRSRGRRTEPAPGIALRVGVGWREVDGPEREGELPDAGYCLHRVALAEAASDDEGQLELELEQPLAFTDADQVWVEVVQEGMQRRVDFEELPEEGAPDALQVFALSGWSLHGQVVDAQERAVPRTSTAWLLLRDDGKQSTSTHDTDNAGPRGGFTLHSSHLDRRLNVYARHQSRGAGAALDVGASDRGPDEVLVVPIEGEGVLAGTLVDPGGAPIAGYALLAVASRERARDRTLGWRQWAQRERAGGLCEGRVWTDDDGGFRFEGLQPGEYHLKLVPGGSSKYTTQVTQDPLPTGREDLELVAPLHRVRLRLREEPEQGVAELHAAQQSQHWMRTDRILVYASRSNGKGRVHDDDDPADGPRVAHEDGREFALQAGRSYLFGAFSRRHAPVEREVFVGETSWYTEVVLDLGAARDPGSVGVRLYAPGHPPPGRFKVRVDVRSLQGGRRLSTVEEWRAANQELRLDPLPAGLFRISARDRGSLSSLFWPADEQVLVPSGGHVSWEAQLLPTGRLEVRVELLSQEPIEPEGFELERLGGIYVRDDERRKRAGGVRLHGFRGGGTGAAQRLTFPSQPLPGGGRTSRSDSWTVPDRDVVASGRIPIGELLVVAEREGYQPAEGVVTIEQDQVARVVLRLVPRP